MTESMRVNVKKRYQETFPNNLIVVMDNGLRLSFKTGHVTNNPPVAEKD